MPTCERCKQECPEQLDMLDGARDFITFYSRGERKHHTLCVKCFYGGRDPYQMTRYQRQLQQQQQGTVILTITSPHNMGGVADEPEEM